MKKIVIPILLLLGLLAYYGVNKYKKFVAALEKLDIDVSNISGLKIANGKISGKVSIAIKNNTDSDMSVNGVIFSITKILLVDKDTGTVLAESDIDDISSLEIAAYDSLKIKDIPVSISILDSLGYLVSTSLNVDTILNNIVPQVQISAMGYKFYV